ncbi:MAG: hypothetical protein KJ052_10130 [Candidatus Hydrogenedentes bacterium]|nr:hypothetical protein [Candidatus Hydrogenedentota bacterium]
MNLYQAPEITAGHGATEVLKGLSGRVLVTTMEEPWKLLQEEMAWSPDHGRMEGRSGLRAPRGRHSLSVFIGGHPWLILSPGSHGQDSRASRSGKPPEA